MGLSRANSLKKASPLLHFKQFQQHLENLKNEVQVYNKRQNCSYALNMMPQSSHNQKRFLKKMTEPKYHKVVIGLIEAKEKAQVNYQRKNSVKTFKSLIYTSVLKNAEQNKQSEFLTNPSTQLSQTQRLKRKQLQSNIKKKQKQLQREWSMVQEYRSQHSMHTERWGCKTKQQKMIIRKVIKNRPQTHSNSQYESECFSRNRTYQSQCLEFR